MINILIVDDNSTELEALSDIIPLSMECTCLTAHDGYEALDVLANNEIDIVLSDLNMSPMDGMDLLDAIQKKYNLPVFIMSALNSIEKSILALQKGAKDYFLKPIHIDECIMKMTACLQERQLKVTIDQLHERLDKTYNMGNMIGRSVQMESLFEKIKLVAPTQASVFIRGESGTGKELIAQALHQGSSRSRAPFIAVNCAALSESLLESELFGHEKGAFTGAQKRHLGKFEAAESGTLFLDEVSEMPLDTQVKLLRVLENRELTRVGGNELVPLNIRVLSACNRNIEEKVNRGEFREDLYYRLKVIDLKVPALRERVSDIDLFLQYFLEMFSKENHKSNLSFSPKALSLLRSYSWPGNVRELRNCMESMVIMSSQPYLDVENIPDMIRKSVFEASQIEGVS